MNKPLLAILAAAAISIAVATMPKYAERPYEVQPSVDTPLLYTPGGDQPADAPIRVAMTSTVLVIDDATPCAPQPNYLFVHERDGMHRYGYVRKNDLRLWCQ